MFAVLLVFLVFVETFLCGWLLREVSRMRKVCGQLGSDVRRLSREVEVMDNEISKGGNDSTSVDFSDLLGANDADLLSSANDVLASASPEELDQASEILKQLGLGGE